MSTVDEGFEIMQIIYLITTRSFWHVPDKKCCIRCTSYILHTCMYVGDLTSLRRLCHFAIYYCLACGKRMPLNIFFIYGLLSMTLLQCFLHEYISEYQSGNIKISRLQAVATNFNWLSQSIWKTKYLFYFLHKWAMSYLFHCYRANYDLLFWCSH